MLTNILINSINSKSFYIKCYAKKIEENRAFYMSILIRTIHLKPLGILYNYINFLILITLFINITF